MEHIAPPGRGVKRPTYPQEMEEAARRFVDAVERVINLSQVNRIVLDRTQIGAIYADGSVGVIGSMEARS